MRQIKFRAFSKNTRKMLNYYELGGNVVHLVQDTQTCVELRHPVSVILMQYTGLKDNAGTDIYEGDIVEKMKSGKKVRQEVRYVEGSVAFRGLSNILSCRVIGNIHDNPKLLKSKKH